MEAGYLKEVVIVDDEVNATAYLENMLLKYKDIRIKKVFNDSKQALSFLIVEDCDILFLDIDMPNIGGIYIAELMLSIHPEMKICFVTAFDEFAVKAFEMSAIDYILKPYTKERLENCLKKLQRVKFKKEVIQELSDCYDYDLEVICGNVDEDIVLINYDEIYYMETIPGGVSIHCKDKQYRGNKPLNFYEEKLKNCSFFRTHKCFLVNLSKVSKLRPRINYTYDMFFKDFVDVVPISRSKVKELKTVLKQL
ncbi:two component transcriptional regulator, LytTR family [Hathewaya proteolytica DSM 3090]|uniref:Stage 0 sporulation protein A homolog n=1 Tax=Hathewaya proteolytica DSM 3090 TaxID=1121331 RepID=A0A1M6SWW7_9CLOT|nr:LytTR family DNA-binding domain-containing protein [Hathewaya proteolytica]SHK49140.1 two component transcriptional regulator, LytTR family [Hathewaya proteolytica DSM 3090]